MSGAPAERYERLFTPMALGRREVKNRIAFPAMITGLGAGNRPTERTVAAYARTAAGGAGMVVSEALAVHPTSEPKPFALVTYDPAGWDGFARIAEAVEREDCRMIGQLYHLGRSQLWTTGDARPMGPSALPDFYSGTMPRVMSHGDIAMLTEAFAHSAAMLAARGFSGVELHAAHGHLLSLFLSPWSNHREDAYGGDVTGRTRFLREVIEAIRAATGPDFVVGLKMPGDEGVRGGLRPADAAALFTRVQEGAPVDYVCFAQGTIAPSFGDHVPDMHYPPTPYLDLQRELRAAAGGVPVVAVGRVRSAAEAETTLRSGAADLVALGRALVADPDLPRKARARQEEQIRPGVYCNACWGEVHAGRPAACPVNPGFGLTAQEAAPAAAASARRVTVVGGGVAGLEAARAAADRGHRVTLLAGPRLGGRTRAESRLPGRGDLGRLVVSQEEAARRAGVEVVLGAQAREADVLATAPDAVVLATGARMRPPAALVGTGINDYLATPAGPASGTAVILGEDDGAAVCALAELRASRHPRTVLLTPRLAPAETVPYTSRLGVHRRLSAARVEVVTGAAARGLDGTTLHYENLFTGDPATVDGVGQVVWATARIPVDDLYGPLRRRGLAVHRVGDAHAPATLLTALTQARTVAEEL
ncbi:oxidoreductase [Streptomyces pinistramenti]|uniref:oxidoreductase n=1 Tax=Streptomyces pinistramenti TaxID=2884812 RepID=UPI001D08DA61|nr:FAD-dependent oxidoreductase [Streptomyces pinistramenti]MCB5906939.1 FAD-dependent oxidoreductase [Streptomyces pinistramenti]